MSKRFNIHEWQAKQKRLAEINPSNVPGTAAWGGRAGLRVGGSYATDDTLKDKISKYIGQTFASWMSPDNPPFAQEYAKSPYIDKLVDGIMGIVDKENVEEHHNDEDFPGKDLSAWDLLDKLKSGDKELYDRVEDFMKSMKEMSMTGGGASFGAGNSMAHLGKKNKRK